MRAPVKLYLASSNPGKLDEFRALADWTRSAAPSTNQASPNDSASEIEFALVPGFASMSEGNIIAESEQWAKMQLVAEVAKKVWG